MKSCGILLCLVLASAVKGEDRKVVVRAGCHRAAVLAEAAPLAVVPFALPIAVPVAVVSQPVVFYARRAEIVAEPTLHVDTLAPETTPPADAIEVLRTHCAACHTGEGAQGSLRLFAPNGVLVERLPRRAILEAVVEQRMPKGAAPLTEEELTLLRKWARPPRELLY